MLAVGVGVGTCFVGAGAGNPATPLTAPILTQTSTAGTNPPEWNSEYDWIAWDSGTNSGTKTLMRWRRVNGGAWTTEAEQPVDDEVLTGGFTWPLLEAAKPLFGGYFEAQEQIVNYIGGVEAVRSAWSSPGIIDTITGGSPGTATNFHLFGGDVRFSQYNSYFRAIDAVVTQETV